VDWRAWTVYGGAGLLAFGGLLALPAMIPRQAFWRRASRFMAIGGLVLCLAAAVVGWVRMGRPPVGGTAETFQLLAVGLVMGYLFVEGLAKSREAGLPALLLAAGLMLAGYRGSPAPAVAGSLPPAMESGWVLPYMVGSFLAYGFLLMGVLQAVVFLVVREAWPRRADRAGRAVYWSVCMGVPFLLWALLAVALWSQGVRGRCWSWTTREVWLLAYCLLLLAYLKLHLIAGWRERRAPWFLVIASLAGIMAFARMRELPTPAGDQAMQVRPPAASPEAD